jgi:hypothetical protein
MTTVISDSKEWFCQKCPVNNNEDCGPWSEASAIFKSCRQMHQSHKGWELFSSDFHDTEPKSTFQDSVNLILGSVNKAEEKERQNDILQEIISLISKTVKGDEYLTRQILFNGFSTFTDKPTHLMIMERSSEGKTYPALEIAKHFPKENVWTFGSVTPQSFKYDHGILVDKEYKPMQERLDNLDEQIKIVTKSQKTDKDSTTQELTNQKKSLLKESKTLIDLRNKWIIFKEPPDHKLLEALYSTLSKDEEYNEHKFVNKTDGRNQNFTVVFHGCPAILICTSKDESRSHRWAETFSRFNIVSPTCTQAKYTEGMELIGKSTGLPRELYEEFVISENEKQRIKELLNRIISVIRATNAETYNPFMDELSKQFPHEAGYRWRQYGRFNNLLSLHCLCYSENRPKLLLGQKRIPIITKADVESILKMIKDGNTVPPNKITWFREVFILAFEKSGQMVDFSSNNGVLERRVITGLQLVQHIEETGRGKTTTKQIRETYLETLFDNGMIEKEKDPRNKTRDVYWLPEGYEKNTESSLVVISSLDESCVTLCLEKYLKQRFQFEMQGKTLSQHEIVPYLLSTENVIQM